MLHRDGKPVAYNTFGHAWQPTAIAAGRGRMVKVQETGRKRYEGLRHHDLRHAYASLLISAGC